MGVGRRQGGACSTLEFKILSKKDCFLSFEREKTSFTTLGPPGNNFGNIP